MVLSRRMEILLDAPDYMVLNKPAGIPVHSDGVFQGETVVSWVIANFPEFQDVGESFVVYPGGVPTALPRAGIVHRLDRDTSGCLLVAKNEETFKYFKRQFQDRDVRKYYEAFVYGVPYPERGLIETPFGRSQKDARLRTGRNPRGTVREAVTRYVVLKTFQSEGATYSLVGLYPKTGRMHQIRVHMKHIQHPIVSDPLYGRGRPEALGMKRVALHARSITFIVRGGKEITCQAPYPSDFTLAIGLAK